MGGKNKKTEIPLWAQCGHKKPVTRREFMSAGLIPFGASMFFSNTSLLSSMALAADSCGSIVRDESMIPFFSINLMGGANIAANVIARDQGGQLLPSYSKMGLGANTFEKATEFGNKDFFAGGPADNYISKMLTGIRMHAGTSLNKSAAFSLCSRNKDDSSENKFSVEGMLQRIGQVGTLLPHLGNRSTGTGLNVMAASDLQPTAPLVVNNLNVVASAVSLKDSLTKLKPEQQNLLIEFASKLSASQARKLASGDQSDFAEFVKATGLRNEDIVKAGAGFSVDPRKDTGVGAAIKTLWGITDATGPADSNVIASTLLYNILLGRAGSGGVAIGGYDYHNNTRTLANTKDQEAGVMIGRALKTAELLNKPLMIFLFTDGSTTSTVSDFSDSPFTSDRGIAGMSLAILFDPKGRRKVTSAQVGYFDASQAVSEKSILRDSPELAANAVIANYLNAMGKIDRFTCVKARTANSDFLDSVLVMSKDYV